VEPVGAPDDEANLGVEALDATVGDALFEGVDDEPLDDRSGPVKDFV